MGSESFPGPKGTIRLGFVVIIGFFLDGKGTEPMQVSTGMWRWWSTARWPESGHLSAEPFEQLWLLEWHCAWCQTLALVKALAPQVKVLGAKPWQNKSVQDKGCTERLCRCLCMLCCHSLYMFLFYMFLLLQREKQLRISVLRKHKKSTR